MKLLFLKVPEHQFNFLFHVTLFFGAHLDWAVSHLVPVSWWLLSGLTQVSVYQDSTWKMAVINYHVLPGRASVFPGVEHIEWPVDAL